MWGAPIDCPVMPSLVRVRQILSGLILGAGGSIMLLYEVIMAISKREAEESEFFFIYLLFVFLFFFFTFT